MTAHCKTEVDRLCERVCLCEVERCVCTLRLEGEREWLYIRVRVSVRVPDLKPSRM